MRGQSPHFQIKPASELLDQETAAYHQLVASVYPPEQLATMPERVIQWATAAWRVMIWDDGKLVCHVGVISRNAIVNGETVRIGGIGGVMTHPEARHRGYATAGMELAATMMETELGASFGLLVCRPGRGGMGDGGGPRRREGAGGSAGGLDPGAGAERWAALRDADSICGSPRK